MSLSEMIFLALLGLVIFGPKKLAELGQQAGQFLARFKKVSSEFQLQIATEISRCRQRTEDEAGSGGGGPGGNRARIGWGRAVYEAQMMRRARVTATHFHQLTSQRISF